MEELMNKKGVKYVANYISQMWLKKEKENGMRNDNEVLLWSSCFHHRMAPESY